MKQQINELCNEVIKSLEYIESLNDKHTDTKTKITKETYQTTVQGEISAYIYDAIAKIIKIRSHNDKNYSNS